MGWDWPKKWIWDPCQKWFLFFFIDIKISHRWKRWCKRIWILFCLEVVPFLRDVGNSVLGHPYPDKSRCLARQLEKSRELANAWKCFKSKTYTFEFWIKRIFAFWVTLIFLLIFSIIDDIQNRMKSVIIYFKSLSDFFLKGTPTKLLSQFIGFYEAKLTIFNAPVLK